MSTHDRSPDTTAGTSSGTSTGETDEGRPRTHGVLRRPAVLLPVLLTGTLLAGCSATAATDAFGTTAADTGTTTTETVSVDVGQTAAEALAENQESHASDDDAEYVESEVVDVTLDGDSATVTAGADGSADAVAVEDGTVTISAAGTYRLGGEYTGGVVVAADDEADVQLILDGVDIANADDAAIGVTGADEVVVILADGSTNTLGDTDAYAEDADIDAALDSTADLTITGDGALVVTGNGNDGIASSDGLVIAGGDITVDAVDDGIRGKDYVIITGGTVSVAAGGDGVKSDNEEEAERGYIAIGGGTVDIVAGGDGLAAETDVIVWGGDVSIEAGGGSGASVADDASAKGVKAGVLVVVDGGSLDVDAADDAVHSDGGVHIADGTVTAATGDDGVHAETALSVSGGVVDVLTSYEGLESVSIDISGGEISIVADDDARAAQTDRLLVSLGEVATGDGDGRQALAEIAAALGTPKYAPERVTKSVGELAQALSHADRADLARDAALRDRLRALATILDRLTSADERS